MQTTITKDTHKQKNNNITSPIPNNNEHNNNNEEQKLKEQLHPLHPFILSTPGKENDTNYRTYPLLLLEIINSWMLPKGLTLKINPFGLENSLRSVKDGITYFGFQEETETIPYYVDYLIIPDEQDYDDKFIGRHFQISFENASNKYYIKDLGHGLGTFIKMMVDLKISDKHLIKIGDTDVVFSLSEDNEIALNDGCANQTLKEQNHDADNNNNNNNVNNNSVANQTGQSVQSNKPKKKAFLTRSMTVNDPKKAKESEE